LYYYRCRLLYDKSLYRRKTPDLRMRATANTRHRVISAMVVGGLHVAVIGLIWELHFARERVVEEIGSGYLFSPGAITVAHAPSNFKSARRRQSPGGAPRGSAESSSAASSPLPPFAPSSAPPAHPTIDWQRSLESVATDVIEQAKIDNARAARMGEPPASASFQPLHVRPHDLEWISERSRLVINAQGVPEWDLIQPCAKVILRNDPECTLEHVEQHGVMFEYIQQQRDATLGYGGPNAVP
jgi:hypothetical protein